MNGVVVYESIDATFLGIIEQALKDHNIPFTVTGGSNVEPGLGSPGIPVRISVDQKFVEEAKAIIEQVSLV